MLYNVPGTGSGESDLPSPTHELLHLSEELHWAMAEGELQGSLQSI